MYMLLHPKAKSLADKYKRRSEGPKLEELHPHA